MFSLYDTCDYKLALPNLVVICIFLSSPIDQNGILWNVQETHRRTGKGKQIQENKTKQKNRHNRVNNKMADLNPNYIKYKVHTNQNKRVTKYTDQH